MSFRPSCVGLALAALLAAAPAAAAPPPVNSPGWAFGSPWGEVAVAGAAVLSLGFVFVPQRQTDWGPATPRPHNEMYDTISDYTGAFGGTGLFTGISYFFEAAYLTQHGAGAPFGNALKVPLLDLEAAALSSGIGFLIKRLSGRCRPRSFKDGHCGTKKEDHDAFPSGHTTPISAVAGVQLALAIRSSGAPGFRYASFAIAETASIATAFLRVAAGAHSWEDVTVGWVLGHATGIAVAYVHPMVDISPPRGISPSYGTMSLSVTPPLMLSWSGQF